MARRKSLWMHVSWFRGLGWGGVWFGVWGSEFGAWGGGRFGPGSRACGLECGVGVWHRGVAFGV